MTILFSSVTLPWEIYNVHLKQKSSYRRHAKSCAVPAIDVTAPAHAPLFVYSAALACIMALQGLTAASSHMTSK